MQFKILATVVAVAPLFVSWTGTGIPVPLYNTTVTATVVVDLYTTYCPEPTVLAYNEVCFTVTEPTLLTITNCPYTITIP